MKNLNKRQPVRVGGKSFAFVIQGYPSSINVLARNLADRGYTYRIFPIGRQRKLYVGPKRKLKKAGKKTKKLKKVKKVKKPKK